MFRSSCVDGEVYRLAAHNGFSPEYQEFVKQHPIAPGRGTAGGANCAERPQRFTCPTSLPTRNTPGTRAADWVDTGPCSEFHCFREGSCIGVMAMIESGGPAVYTEADRAGHHLRRPGGDRHRERAAVRGRARAYARAVRIARSADGGIARCCSSSAAHPAN